MIAGTNRNRVSKRAMRPKLAPAPVIAPPPAPPKPDNALKPTLRVVLIRLDGDKAEFVEERFRTWSEYKAERFCKDFNENPQYSEPLVGPRKLLAVIQPLAADE